MHHILRLRVAPALVAALALLADVAGAALPRSLR